MSEVSAGLAPCRGTQRVKIHWESTDCNTDRERHRGTTTKTEWQKYETSGRKPNADFWHSPIYQNLFSKQLFPKDQFPTEAQQWTADSLSSKCWQLSRECPVKSQHTETSKQTQNCIWKGGCCRHEKVWYDAVWLHHTACYGTMGHLTILQTHFKKTL